MSLSARTMKVTYTANGTLTTFALPDVPIVDDSAEVKVYTRDESSYPASVNLQTEGALNDYTLTGAPDNDSFHVNVEFNSAPANGIKVIIALVQDFTQALDYNGNNSAGVRPTQLEQQLDVVTGLAQQLEEQLTRVPKMDITEQQTEAALVLPGPNSGTEGIFGWGTDGVLRLWTVSEIAVAAANIPDTDSIPEGVVNLYYTDARVDTRFATLFAAEDTDGLSEGVTNLYYTNARADARIAAANIQDLANVTIGTPSTDQVLTWNGSAWVNQDASGGGGGGALQVYSTGSGPQEIVQNSFLVLDFIDATGIQSVYFEYRVPQSYKAGTQIVLRGKFFSPATSGTILLETRTNLWEDGDTSSADAHDSTQAAITQDVANELESVTMDLTDGSGQINGNAVAAGDMLRVNLKRDTANDTCTDSAYLIKSSLEVSING